MNKTAGIYIHIPFCERKCTYCNFNTTDFVEELAGRYAQAVASEVHYWGDRLARDHKSAVPLPVDTVYFGGGTPSIVAPEHLAMVLEACRAAFDVSPDAEITIEINPASVNEAQTPHGLSRRKLESWREAGINRASVGVQSFIDRELVALSRTHTATDACRIVEALRYSGFDNLSLDLIAGLPEQTRENWGFNLRQALLLEPDHLSLYLLEVKEATQLFAQIKRGWRSWPDDDLAAEMYRMICEATREAGYEHYEISNFALVRETEGPSRLNGPNPEVRKPTPRSSRSKHNLKYWTGASFYGMGCGAHSYDGRARWVNVMKTESYIDAVSATGCAISERRELSDEERASEGLFMGLRLAEGVDVGEFKRGYGVDVPSRYEEELQRLTEAGLVEIDGNRLWLTERGMLLSNEVFVEFV